MCCINPSYLDIAFFNDTRCKVQEEYLQGRRICIWYDQIIGMRRFDVCISSTWYWQIGIASFYYPKVGEFESHKSLCLIRLILLHLGGCCFCMHQLEISRYIKEKKGPVPIAYNNSANRPCDPPTILFPSSRSCSVIFFFFFDTRWKLCSQAQYLIFEKMREEGYVSGTEDVRLTIEILVPSAQVGRIIGKGGQNVRELQRVTGSVIKLSEQQATPPSADEETTVHIIGPFFSVQVNQPTRLKQTSLTSNMNNVTDNDILLLQYR